MLSTGNHGPLVDHLHGMTNGDVEHALTARFAPSEFVSSIQHRALKKPYGAGIRRTKSQ